MPRSPKTKILFFFFIFFLGVLFSIPKKAQAVECCCNESKETCVDKTPGVDCAAPYPRSVVTNTNCQKLGQVGVLYNQRRQGWVSKIIGTDLINTECTIGGQSKEKPCEIKHIIQVFVNITKLILGLIGSFALLMFIYGGFMFLISAGSADRVNTAKRIIVNAVIGIAIVFTSWILVNFIIIALSSGKSDFSVNAVDKVFK